MGGGKSANLMLASDEETYSNKLKDNGVMYLTAWQTLTRSGKPIDTSGLDRCCCCRRCLLLGKGDPPSPLPQSNLHSNLTARRLDTEFPRRALTTRTVPLPVFAYEQGEVPVMGDWGSQ